MIVDRDDRILFLFAQGADNVIGTFLHLWVSTLYGIQLDARRIASCLNRRYRAATKSDAIVLTTHYDNLVARLWSALDAVALDAIADTSSKHYHLVVGIFLIILFMLECQHRTTNQWLAEFVTKVRSTIRCLNEYLFRSLIEPLTLRHILLPGIVGALLAWIRCHIDSSSCYRPRTYATTHTVANLTASTCCSTIERFYGSREVVCLSLQGDDTLYLLNVIEIRSRVVSRGELLYLRTLTECHIILVCRQYLVRILLCCLLNHLEQRRLHLLTIDDECATEYLVAAVLRVNLCEAKELRVSQRTAQLLCNIIEVCYFLF